MPVNRFQNFYAPQYTPEPLDQLLAVGMQKRQQLLENVQNLTETANTLGNIPSIGIADTNKKNEILQQAQDKANEIIKSGKNLDDPMVSYQLKGLVNGVISNPDIQKIVGTYQNYQKYLASVDKTKDEGKYAESHDFPVASKWNDYITNDQYNPQPVMQQYTRIDQPSDYRKKITDIFNQVKASGTITEATDGTWIWKDSQERVDPHDLIKWGLNQGFLSQNDLKSLKYDAGYQYEALDKGTKQRLSPQRYEDMYYQNTLEGIAPFYGYSKTGHEMQADPYGVAAYGEALKDKPDKTMEVAAPGMKVNASNVLGDVGLNASGQFYKPAAKGKHPWSEMFYGMATSSTSPNKNYITKDNLTPTQKAMYNDLENVVKKKLGLPNLAGKDLEKAVYEYASNYEDKGVLATPIFNAYRVEDAKTAANVKALNDNMFEKVTSGKDAGNWTGRGLIESGIVYDQEHPQGISGSEFSKEFKGKLHPLIVGTHGADTPYPSTGGYVFQDPSKPNDYHYLEVDQQLKTNPIAIYSNKIYQSKYTPGLTNYFSNSSGDNYKSIYDPATKTFALQELDKDLNPVRTVDMKDNPLDPITGQAATPTSLLERMAELQSNTTK